MKRFIIVILVSILYSCSFENRGRDIVQNQLTPFQLQQRDSLHLSPFEYVNWVHEPSSKLYYSKTIGAIKYELLYKPIDYIISKETKGRKITQTEYNSLKSEFGSMDYFDFRISIKNYSDEFLRYDLEDISQYQDRINYCAFRMENDIKMVDVIDSVACALFHFERTFNIAPYGQFLLAFPKASSSTASRTLVFHDYLFSNGTIKIVIDPAALSHLPKLKTI